MWLSGLHVHWLAAYDRVERNRPFEMLLDPQVNANTLTLAADAGGVKNPSVSGLTLVEVGMKVGAGPQAVRRAPASHGIVIRPGGGRRSRVATSLVAVG